MRKFILFLLVFIQLTPLAAMKVERVILATNDNPAYYPYWPAASKAWSDIIGFKPTLILIATQEFMDQHPKIFDQKKFGPIIRMDPIEGMSTAKQAQAVRLFAPSYFPDEVCMTSDIDMIPLSRSYFRNNVKKHPKDAFVAWRWTHGRDEYTICYLSALGKTFMDIFNMTSPRQIPQKLKEVDSLNLGWFSDQIYVTTKAREWNQTSGKLIAHRGSDARRCRRHYNYFLAKANYYFDYSTPRLLKEYYEEVCDRITAMGHPELIPYLELGALEIP